MVAKNDVAVPSIDWTAVTTLADAKALLGVVVDAAEAFGDGSEFITDKDKLVGRAFLVIDWKWITDEASGREYVNVHVMGENGDRARFNDGSTGVYAQLKETEQLHGSRVGIVVKNGLRRSDYTTEINGKPTKAKTYYFSS